MPLYRWAYEHYFRVQTNGWENIPATGPCLFVGSHNGGLAAPDMHMLVYDWMQRFGVERPIYGLMHPQVWSVSPRLGKVATQFGAVRSHPKMAIAAFAAGASVLVYPGGAQDAFRPYAQRARICFAGRQGFIKLALRQGVPIIPAISWGAHDTLIVLDDCYTQVRKLHDLGLPWPFNRDPEVFPIYLGLPWGLAIGPLPNLPLPSKIYTRIGSPIHFERTGRSALKDTDYIEDCYHRVYNQMQAELNQLITEVT